MRPMFVLRNIAAVNFYLYAQDFPIDSRGNTVFLGGNGSGKSVLLDAIQIVMTGMHGHFLDLNSRVSEGGRNTRTVREACLGLLDDGEGFERKSCLTYIALGFESTDGKSRCTAGVCISARESLNEETVVAFFVAENVILRFNDFVHHGNRSFEEKEWSSFSDEQRRKGVQIHTFTRQANRQFLRHLYSIINANSRGTQLDPDRARAAVRHALSFDIERIKNVTDFVKGFLLDPAPIEIETFQARYTTWRNMQKDILQVEAEIRAVESIRAQCERVMEEQFNTRYWRYGQNRAEYDRCSALIAAQRQQVSKLKSDLADLEAYRPALAAKIRNAREFLDIVVKQIPSSAQIQQEQAKKETVEAQRRAASLEAKGLFDAFAALRQAASGTDVLKRQFPAIAQFAQSQLTGAEFAVYEAIWPRSPRQITEAIRATPALGEAAIRFAALHSDAAARRATLEREQGDARKELKNLQDGGSMVSGDTRAFLDDMRRMRVPAHTLAELADLVPNFGEWRGIVEAVLGDWCEAVIVEPAYMDQAYGHFDAHYKGRRVKLVQSERTSPQDLAVKPGSLAETVNSSNQHARAFLNARLGRIQRARSADDIRRGDLAASADGKYAHGRGIEYRHLRTIPRLGKSARDQQLSQLKQDEERLQQPLQEAREQELRLLGIAAGLKRADEILVHDRQAAVTLLERIESQDVEIQRQAALISRLEAELPKDLIAEKRRLEKQLGELETEQKEEGRKERELIGSISRAEQIMQGTIEQRRSAGEEARRAIPSWELRKTLHRPPVGLESFVRRAKAAFRQEMPRHESSAHLRVHFERLIGKGDTANRGMRLAAAIHDYVLGDPDKRHPGFEWSDAISGGKTVNLYDWIGLRHRELTETVLKNFKVQVDMAVQALVETMVHDFLSRLRANIDSVARVKDDLNRSLRKYAFMSEVYQIRYESDQDKATIRYLIDRLDVVAPKATQLMQSETDSNDPDQVKIKELIELLTFEGNDEAAHRKQLRELADYRNYFRFSIDICDPERDYKKISDLEHRRGKASGGQKFVPFYICLGVAAEAAYRNHLGDTKDGPPQSGLLLMDEAFEKLDPENIYKVIDFYKELGLQLVMAAPKTHQALYQENFNTLISIVRKGRNIQATAQHFHDAAQDLLRSENPMHKPRSYFEERVRRDRDDAAD